MTLSIPNPPYVSVMLLLLSGVFVSMPTSAITSPLEELQQAGFYGRVHAWNNVSRKAHNIKVKVPKRAPIIISDYHSPVGANGLRRTGKHRGVDMFAEIGSPVIAAADGVVIRAKVDRCWGPSMLISHGLDKVDKPVYALYGHVKNFKVSVGQKVKRGQQIAEMGNDIFTSCGAGFHHLHFQVSYNPQRIPFGWGWASFVGDGTSAPNPHNYWENGAGKVTCFDEGKSYDKSGFTYPLPCKNKSKPIPKVVTIVAKNEQQKSVQDSSKQQTDIIDVLDRDLKVATKAYKEAQQAQVIKELEESLAAAKSYEEEQEAEHMNRIDQEFITAGYSLGGAN